MLPEQDDSPFEELKLIRLLNTFCSDTQLQNYLGKLQLQSTTDSELWNEIQRLLLRVPTNVADCWRHRLLQLVDRG